MGTQVTFWGAQWWKLNSLSGVAYAPAAFKGYITTPLPSPPVVDGTWRTDPGNSSNPPASIPTYVAVVVTSSTTKSGSLITGNVVAIAIVRTDSGYAGNPGHAGTGTIGFRGRPLTFTLRAPIVRRNEGGGRRMT